MLGNHPSIVIPQNSEYAKEMRRHEAHHTSYGPPGRPYVFQEFPKRLYRAMRGEHGPEFEALTVASADEQRNLQSRGFALSQTEALTALDREQTEHGKLAAEREWQIQHGRHSERAVEEIRAAESEHGARHLPSVPETPIRRVGRPKGSKNKPNETV